MCARRRRSELNLRRGVESWQVPGTPPNGCRPVGPASHPVIFHPGFSPKWLDFKTLQDVSHNKSSMPSHGFTPGSIPPESATDIPPGLPDQTPQQNGPFDPLGNTYHIAVHRIITKDFSRVQNTVLFMFACCFRFGTCLHLLRLAVWTC